MIDARKELSDIALQNPASTRVVLRDLIGECPKPIHRFVCPFPETAGIRISNECSIKERVQLAIERVVDEPVAHTRFVDVAWLRVTYFEMMIPAVLISAIRKFVMQNQNIIHQMPFKFLNISPFALAFYEFSPWIEQILDRNDTLVFKIP